MNKMTKTEARILMFLKQTDERHHWTGQISTKLSIDYAYLLKTLKDMVEKNWLTKRHTDYNKCFYSLTGKANLELAKQIIAGKEKKHKQTVLLSLI